MIERVFLNPNLDFLVKSLLGFLEKSHEYSFISSIISRSVVWKKDVVRFIMYLLAIRNIVLNYKGLLSLYLAKASRTF